MSKLTFSKMMPISERAEDGAEMWATIDGWEFACITERTAQAAGGSWLVESYDVELIDCGRMVNVRVKDSARDALESALRFVRDVSARLHSV